LLQSQRSDYLQRPSRLLDGQQNVAFNYYGVTGQVMSVGSLCLSKSNINLQTLQFHCFWACHLELFTSIFSRFILITRAIPPVTTENHIYSVRSTGSPAGHCLGRKVCALQVCETKIN